MTKLLLKLPWFLSAPAVIALAAVLALGANMLLGEYFERSRVDEADPFAAPVVEAAGDPLVERDTCGNRESCIHPD